MNALHPIYTARTECQDCYKCIRGCPVKAIKVEGGYASIEPNRCIFCGHCVETCPNGAKKVRDDQHRVERLLKGPRPVYVSLAPSFASEFAPATPAQVVESLRRLGFHAVSETALGAQEVSARVREMLQGDRQVLISTACPVVVEYIRRYRASCVGLLTPLLSPMLSHTRLLRAEYGDDIRVVFVGPCIAKKSEADAHPELVDAALTFEDVRQWMRRLGFQPEDVEAPGEAPFVPRAAGAGSLYPIEGGMIHGIRRPDSRARFMSFSGMEGVVQALDGVEGFRSAQPLFLELLACAGGCINGPKARRVTGMVPRRHEVEEYSRTPEDHSDAGFGIAEGYEAAPIAAAPAGEAQIREVLRAVGKHGPEDELNCGGCGYDSCRAFASAFLMGRAERRMCVTYMRKLAEKKTHVLMQKMPSAVVLVDDGLRILECNPSFVRFFGPAESEGQSAALEGQTLDALVPFYNLFEHVLETGEEVRGKDIRYNRRVFHVTVFSVEPHAVVGGIFRDETQPAVEKEQIIGRARQVIQKNLKTVQQIAYLIGENAAESEIALNAIVDSFSPEKIEDHGKPE